MYENRKDASDLIYHYYLKKRSRTPQHVDHQGLGANQRPSKHQDLKLQRRRCGRKRYNKEERNYLVEGDVPIRVMNGLIIGNKQSPEINDKLGTTVRDELLD